MNTIEVSKKSSMASPFVFVGFTWYLMPIPKPTMAILFNQLVVRKASVACKSEDSKHKSDESKHFSVHVQSGATLKVTGEVSTVTSNRITKHVEVSRASFGGFINLYEQVRRKLLDQIDMTLTIDLHTATKDLGDFLSAEVQCL